MTSFVFSTLYNKFLFSSHENPGMFPPHRMPECLILLTVNRRQIFLSGLLNISFQTAYTTSVTSTTFYPLNCLQLWKEVLGSAPNCQPLLLLVSTIKHWKFLRLLLHWPAACFSNPAVSSDPLRFLQQAELIPLALTRLHSSPLQGNHAGVLWGLKWASAFRKGKCW